ncbi:hypothetical protein F4814DRAFT_432655 [Daldinia grandis]|nr:hypothetical protein F4814DRAFT_432655 [Daldinia grandis]
MPSYHGRYPGYYINRVIDECRMGHGPASWDHFTIPDTLLGPLSTSQPSIFVRLPPELLHSIFGYLDPFGRVCLALACKHLLHASCLASMKIPSAAKHRQLCPPSCMAMRTLLHLVLPIRPGGKPDRAIAVCSYCYRHRPTKTSYWKHIRGKFPKHWPSGAVDSRIESWARHSSIQCPECLLEEELLPEEKYISKT